MTPVAEIVLEPAHPAFDGHFPGFPVAPGALLLDEILQRLSPPAPHAGATLRIATAKFPSFARPGERLTLEQRQAADGRVHFQLRAGPRIVATGVLAAA